ncbi:MAG TPA: ImmA/IrrE family metallo-endopeptidase [Ktedonobacteraceae bacterium]|nr:ImmA/IrrE family metallo-endopeptidase [Ktedonobacteraceae bacterium]
MIEKQRVETVWTNRPNFKHIQGQQQMERKRMLAMDAMSAALQLRQSEGFGLWVPVCPYDLAEKLNVEVRFIDLPSMEGMYSKDSKPIILISSLRPAGRQAFTCTHELGHHVFKHGTHVDEVINPQLARSQSDDKEFLANCFAGFLLMPKSAVNQAFATRGWDIRSCTPLQLYTIAGWFGVGYATLIHHLSSTLKLLPQASANSLKKVSPKDIRLKYLDKEMNGDLILVDAHWSERAIDIQVGDYVHLPVNSVIERECVRFQEQDEKGSLFCAVAPGIGRFYQPDTGWSAFVRVSRREYIGRNMFRHLEDSDDD